MTTRCPLCEEEITENEKVGQVHQKCLEQPDFIMDQNGRLKKITKRRIEPGDWVTVETDY